MRRTSSRIREEIERLQEQLKQAETKEAERIGRLALRAGLGDIVVSEAELLAGLQEMTKRFQVQTRASTSRPPSDN